MENVRLCLDEHLARELQNGASPSPISIPEESELEKAVGKSSISAKSARKLCAKLDESIQVRTHTQSESLFL